MAARRLQRAKAAQLGGGCSSKSRPGQMGWSPADVAARCGGGCSKPRQQWAVLTLTLVLALTLAVILALALTLTLTPTPTLTASQGSSGQ